MKEVAAHVTCAGLWVKAVTNICWVSPFTTTCHTRRVMVCRPPCLRDCIATQLSSAIHLTGDFPTMVVDCTGEILRYAKCHPRGSPSSQPHDRNDVPIDVTIPNGTLNHGMVSG